MNQKWISLAVISVMLLSTFGVSGMATMIPSQEKAVMDPTIDEFDFADISFVEMNEDVDEELTVNPNYISFDPLKERPLLPDDLSFSGDLYLVQFKDKIHTSTKDRVTALGAELLQYIPYYAFVVRMDPSSAKAVKELPTVRAVTHYNLFFKMAPDVVGLQEGKALVNFMVWRHHSTEGVAAHARAIGADIDWVDPIMVRAWVDRTQMLNIASNTDVWYAQMHPVWELHNNVDSDIIDVRHYPNGAYNNPTDGVWTYSGGVGGTFQGLATGLGTIVSDVDTGVDGTHNNFGDATDFPNKKVWFKSYASGSTWFDNNGHGTHTSGTAVGIGKHRNGAFDGLYTGMAPEAGLVGIRMDGGSVYNWMNDPYDHGANISTNSWGGGTLGSYDQSAAAYDSLVIDVELQEGGKQPMATFFSAGNSGANGLSPPATGKNVISVGASGGTSGSQNSVAGFSSRGPLADGRMKPEIVAPGTSITSSWRGSSDFRDAQGTSMSCPTTAGAAALIIDYYNTTYGFTPSPALIKVLMVNGAVKLGYTYPGNTQGWGRLNVANSLIETATKSIFFKEEDDTLGIDTGMFVSYPITVNTNAELRIHLTWLDEPGSPGANPALVNDIDVRLKDPGGNTYMGNQFAGGTSSKSTTSDTKNNLEGFRFTNPATGVWTLEIIGSNIPEGPQVWAMVISGDMSVGDPTLHFLDLGITEVKISNQAPVEGDEITLSAKVKNVGNLPGLDIDWRIKMDDSTLDMGSIPSLAVDAETEISTPWTAVRGNHKLLVEIDYMDDLIELDEDNNTKEKVFLVNNYGVLAKVVPGLQEVQPGDNTTFRVEIENIGTLPDVYDIEITYPPDGFGFDMETLEADINIGLKKIINLEVSTPDQAEAGTEIVASITITSRGNATYSEVVEATTEIKRIFGFDIVPLGGTTAYVEPTGMVEFEVNMSNLGNDQEMVTVTLSDTNPSFTSMTNATNLVLAAYQTEVVKLSVTPPFQPMGGDYVMVTLTAETSSDLSDYEDFTVNVIDYHNLSIVTVLDDNEVDPGGDLDFESVLTNFGNNDESVEMWAGTPDDWEVVFDEEMPYIFAYGYLENFFTLTVPDDALSGTYNVTIGATGEYIEYEEEFEIIVTQNYGVSIDIAPVRNSVKQNEKVTYTLKVTNDGNGEDTFDLVISGGPSNLRPTFENDEVTIAAGAVEDVRVTFEAMNTLPGSYSLTAEAISHGNKAKSDKIVFQLQVIEVKKEDPKPKPKPPIVIINDDDPTNSGLMSKYGLALLLGAIILIALIILGVWAYKRRKRAQEMEPPPDMGPEPAPGPTVGMMDMDAPPEQPRMGPSPSGPPGPPPEGDVGPVQMGPPMDGPPTTEPPPEPTGPPPEGPPPADGPPPPSVQPQEPAPAPEGPPPETPPPEPSPPLEPPPEPAPAQPATAEPGPEKPKPKGDEIDSMISDLMGKLD